MTDNDLSRRPDGGPAFPVGMNTQHNQYACAVGMSLRDYFAGQVMTEMIRLSLNTTGGWDDATVAHGCYRLADAMLAERSKSSSKE